MLRLMSTSTICLSFMSLSASRSIFMSFLFNSIFTGESLKSNRLVISFLVTFTALSRTCWSTLLTISNDGIASCFHSKAKQSQPKTLDASRPLKLLLPAGFDPVLFVAGPVPVGTRTGHTLEGLPEVPAKGQGYLPAVPAVGEGGFRL